MDFFKVVMVVWVVWGVGGVIYILPSASVIGFQLWGCGGRVSREVTNKDPQLPSFQPRSQSSDAVQPLAPVTHHCPKRRHWSQSEPELVTQACLCDLSSAGGLCTVPHPHPLTPLPLTVLPLSCLACCRPPLLRLCPSSSCIIPLDGSLTQSSLRRSRITLAPSDHPLPPVACLGLVILTLPQRAEGQLQQTMSG